MLAYYVKYICFRVKYRAVLIVPSTEVNILFPLSQYLQSVYCV